MNIDPAGGRTIQQICADVDDKPQKPNRAERRRLAKYGDVNGAKPTVTTNDYIHYCCLSFVDAMHCIGVSNDDIKAVLRKVTYTMDCLSSGHIKASDIEQMCIEEVGVNMIRGL